MCMLKSVQDENFALFVPMIFASLMDFATSLGGIYDLIVCFFSSPLRPCMEKWFLGGFECGRTRNVYLDL